MSRVERTAIAACIDHTLLDPGATRADMDRWCEGARELGFATVCVHPAWVAYCARRLEGSPVRVCSVVGFPSGAHRTDVKAFEAGCAVGDGASEIDVMIHLGALKGGDHDLVRDDLTAVVAAAHPAAVKVILETGRLSEDEKRTGARLAIEAGAAFVKTSTGFGGSGATLEDVRLLRAVVGPDRGVKASGGIRTLEQAIAMLDAGATRLGTSAGVAIVGGGSGAA